MTREDWTNAHEQIRRNFLIGAFDHFDEAFSIHADIFNRFGIDREPAVEIMNDFVLKVREGYPIRLFQSQREYGDMEELDFRRLAPHEIYNSVNELAGPPYFYFHIEYSDEILADLQAQSIIP